MSAPVISALPPAPRPTDNRQVFNQKAFAHVDSLSTLVSQMNEALQWVNGATTALPIVSPGGGVGAGVSSVSFLPGNAGYYVRIDGSDEVSLVITAENDAIIPAGSKWLISNQSEAVAIWDIDESLTVNGESPIAISGGGFLIKVDESQYDFVSFAAEASSEGGGGGYTPPVVYEVDGSEIDRYVTGASGFYYQENGFVHFSLWVRGGDNSLLYGNVATLPAPVAVPSGAGYYRYSAVFDYGGGGIIVSTLTINNSGLVELNTAPFDLDGVWVNYSGSYPVASA